MQINTATIPLQFSRNTTVRRKSFIPMRIKLLTVAALCCGGYFKALTPGQQQWVNATSKQVAQCGTQTAHDWWNSNTVDQNSTQVQYLVQALFQQESSNDPKLVNKHSGAIGISQVMPYNVKRWTKQYYGTELTPEQFRKNTAAQKAVTYGWVTDTWNKASKTTNSTDKIVQMTATSWYKGIDDMNNYNDDTPCITRTKSGNVTYPSRREYAQRVLALFNKKRNGKWY